MCLDALDLVGLQFNRRLAAEHRNQYLNLSSLFVNLANFSFKVLERAVDDADRIALGEVYRVANGVAFRALEDFLRLFGRKRHCLICRADKTGNLRGITHDAPCIIGRYHVDHDVAGKYLLAHFRAAAVLYLYFLLRRHYDVKYFLFHTERLDALLEISRDSVFIAGIRVNSEPLAFLAVCLLHSWVVVAETGVDVASGTNAGVFCGRISITRARPVVKT